MNPKEIPQDILELAEDTRVPVMKFKTDGSREVVTLELEDFGQKVESKYNDKETGELKMQHLFAIRTLDGMQMRWFISSKGLLHQVAAKIVEWSKAVSEGDGARKYGDKPLLRVVKEGFSMDRRYSVSLLDRNNIAEPMKVS